MTDSHLTNKQRQRIRRVDREFSKFYLDFVVRNRLTLGEEIFLLNSYLQDSFREIEKKWIREEWWKRLIGGKIFQHLLSLWMNTCVWRWKLTSNMRTIFFRLFFRFKELSHALRKKPFFTLKFFQDHLTEFFGAYKFMDTFPLFRGIYLRCAWNVTEGSGFWLIRKFIRVHIVTQRKLDKFIATLYIRKKERMVVFWPVKHTNAYAYASEFDSHLPHSRGGGA